MDTVAVLRHPDTGNSTLETEFCLSLGTLRLSAFYDLSMPIRDYSLQQYLVPLPNETVTRKRSWAISDTQLCFTMTIQLVSHKILLLCDLSLSPYFSGNLRKTNVACTDLVAPAIASCSDEAMNIIKVLKFFAWSSIMRASAGSSCSLFVYSGMSAKYKFNRPKITVPAPFPRTFWHIL